MNLDDFFKNPSPDQFEDFVHETLKTFDSLRETIQSGTEEEKAIAFETAQNMQEKLREFAEATYAKAGMTEADVQELLSQGKYPTAEKALREIKEFS